MFNIYIICVTYDLSYLNKMENSTCRICGNIADTILDLGRTPLANSLVDKETKEDTYELKLQYCENCGNFQLSQCIDNELLYSNYLYQTPNSELLRSDVPSVVVPKRLPIFSPNNTLNASITSSCSIPAVIVLPDLNLALSCVRILTSPAR